MPGAAIVNVEQQLQGISDFTELIKDVDRSLSGSETAFAYTVDEMRLQGVRKEGNEVYPLVVMKNEWQAGSRELQWFDLILSVHLEPSYIGLSLEYNGKRMRGDRMKSILSKLIEFLGYLSEQSIRKENVK
ncbi:hypothetical protein D3C74_330460 [compost metagenome]